MHTTFFGKRIWLFLALLLSTSMIRLLWIDYSQSLDDRTMPPIVDGVLDLREYDLSNKQTMRLDGQWAFYPSRFLYHSGDVGAAEEEAAWLTAPGEWSKTFADQNRSSHHYGTLRLLILLESSEARRFALSVDDLAQASEVYVNGQFIKASGTAAATAAGSTFRNIPYTAVLEPDEGTLELALHVAGAIEYDGVPHSIRFGVEEGVQLRTWLTLGSQLLLMLFIFVHSLYALVLSLLDSRNRSLLFFFMISVCWLISILVDDNKLLFFWLDVSPLWQTKLIFLSYSGSVIFIPLLMQRLFPAYLSARVIRLFSTISLIHIFVVALTPISFLVVWRIAAYSILVAAFILSALILWKAAREKADIGILLASCATVGINIIWAMFNFWMDLEMIHYSIDLMLALLLFSSFWFKRYFRVSAEAEQLAKQLQAEEKNKDEFLINTSHELRNPLHGIINVAQLLIEDKAHPLHAEHKRRLDILLHVSRRLTLLLDDLLDVTRLKENTIRLNRHRISLPAVAAGVLDMAKLMLNGKQVRIRSEIEPDLPQVMADENRIIQILFNLLHNAIKFTDRGVIAIRVKKAGQHVLVEVEDSGVGIEEERLGHIFRPYWQSEHNETRATGGVGIGLSICRQLVELHGGTLTVRSTLGRGSTFRFTLPLAKGAGDSLADNDNSPLAAAQQPQEIAWTASFQQTAAASVGALVYERRAKILVVDDDHINLGIMRDMLSSEDYDVYTAAGSEQALAILERHPVDLVVSDVMMPGMSGYALTGQIRERFPLSDLPILLLTARSSSNDIVTGFQSGANDYISKPVDAWVLKARVRALTQLKMSFEDRLRLEGAWMQSQIQPHFLFNTLTSIAALGTENLPKMQSLLEAFSNYLRLSFDFQNAEPIVPLEHELELVRSYLHIEKERFGDRLAVEWNVEQQLDFRLPPLSVQPLVENAIRHGLMQRAGGGTLVISIRQCDACYEIAIRDDGVGIPEAAQQQLLSLMKAVRSGTGVGLRNIDRRLKQRYNRGLCIDSAVGRGTTVSFQIPKPPLEAQLSAPAKQT